MRRKAVAAATGLYVALLSGFILVDAMQTRLYLLIGAIAIIGLTSAYFIWALGTEMWRSLEDGD